MSTARPVILAATVSLIVGVLWAGPALASAEAMTQHATIDVAGAVIACETRDLTITGGTFAQTLHMTQSAGGLFHIAGIGVPQRVALVDGAGAAYSLSGATTFSMTSSDPSGAPLVLTSTDFFVIHDAAGRPVDAVRVLQHLSPSGDVVDLEFGSCQPPA